MKEGRIFMRRIAWKQVFPWMMLLSISISYCGCNQGGRWWRGGREVYWNFGHEGNLNPEVIAISLFIHSFVHAPKFIPLALCLLKNIVSSPAEELGGRGIEIVWERDHDFRFKMLLLFSSMTWDLSMLVILSRWIIMHEVQACVCWHQSHCRLLLEGLSVEIASSLWWHARKPTDTRIITHPPEVYESRKVCRSSSSTSILPQKRIFIPCKERMFENSKVPKVTWRLRDHVQRSSKPTPLLSDSFRLIYTTHGCLIMQSSYRISSHTPLSSGSTAMGENPGCYRSSRVSHPIGGLKIKIKKKLIKNPSHSLETSLLCYTRHFFYIPLSFRFALISISRWNATLIPHDAGLAMLMLRSCCAWDEAGD